MKSKASRKNRFKKTKFGSGPDDYQNRPDIENQYDNVRYETSPDIENQLNKDTYENRDVYINTDIEKYKDIDKPKNVIEYVPLQKETFIEPLDEDIEINIPSDERIDLGNSGYGVYDKQFYGGITKKRRGRRVKKSKTRRQRKNKLRPKNKSKKYNKSNKSLRI